MVLSWEVSCSDATPQLRKLPMYDIMMLVDYMNRALHQLGKLAEGVTRAFWESDARYVAVIPALFTGQRLVAREMRFSFSHGLHAAEHVAECWTQRIHK